jgi:hypothetical protein
MVMNVKNKPDICNSGYVFLNLFFYRKLQISRKEIDLGGNETFNLNSEILRIYRSIDRNSKRIQRAASLSCPKGCGLCCKTQKIEATILEMLPLAEAIFENKEEETILLRVENLIEQNDFSCALFSLDADIPGNGKCT